MKKKNTVEAYVKYCYKNGKELVESRPMKKKKIIEAYVIYYRRNGKKIGRIKNSLREVHSFKNQLKRNKMKYLGNRSIKLVEI